MLHHFNIHVYKDANLITYRIETVDFETYLALMVSDFWFAAQIVYIEKVAEGWIVKEEDFTIHKPIPDPKLTAQITKAIEDWLRYNDAAFTP